jgi:hypothetical protein
MLHSGRLKWQLDVFRKGIIKFSFSFEASSINLSPFCNVFVMSETKKFNFYLIFGPKFAD